MRAESVRSGRLLVASADCAFTERVRELLAHGAPQPCLEHVGDGPALLTALGGATGPAPILIGPSLATPDLVRAAGRASPDSAIVVVAADPDPYVAADMIRAGATKYLLACDLDRLPDLIGPYLRGDEGRRHPLPRSSRAWIGAPAPDIPPFASDSPEPVLRVDGKGTLLYANPASEALLEAWGTRVGAPLPESWVRTVAAALEAGSSRRAEAPAGDAYYDLLLLPLVDRGEVHICGRDLSEGRRLWRELRADRELLQTIFDSIPVMLAVYDPQIEQVTLSKHVERVTGWTDEDIARASVMELAYPDPQYRREIAEYMRSLEPGFRDIDMTTRDGGIVHTSWANIPLPDGRQVGIGIDVTERRQAEARIARQNRVLASINRIFEEAITCESEEVLGKTCLQVALELTGSVHGFVGNATADDLLHTIAISDMGWSECTQPAKDAGLGAVGDLPIRGLYGRVLRDGESLRTNAPSAHPQSGGVPEGHPPLSAFLGVPLRHAGDTLGILAVANRPGGYTPEQQEDLEALAPAVVESLLRIRAEEALRQSEQRLSDELDTALRLHRVSTQLIREDEVEALCEQILDTAVTITGADFGSIQMLHTAADGESELELLGHRGFSAEAAEFWRWVRSTSSSACGEVLRTGRRVVVPDVRQCDFLAGSDDLRTCLESGILAAQTTPLVSRTGALLGVISTHWRRPHRPGASDLRALDILAREAADLIERARAEEALRQSEAQLRDVLENPRDAIYRRDLQTGTYGYFSPSIEALTGYTAEELIRMGSAEVHGLVHPDDLPNYLAHTRALQDSPDPSPVDAVECRWRVKGGEYRWFSTSRRLLRGPDGRPVAHVGTIRDISDRRARDALLERRLQDLAVLYDASQALLGGLEEAEILERVCQVGVEHFGLRLAWVGLVEGEELCCRAVAGHHEGFPAHVCVSMKAPEYAGLTSVQALDAGQTVVVPDCRTDPSMPGGWRDWLLSSGCRSLVGVPFEGANLRGVLMLYAAEPAAFDGEQLTALQSLANLAAVGLEKARLYASVQRHAGTLEEQVTARTAELGASEARFRAVYEGAPVGVALVGLDGRVLDVNPALEALVGWSAEELRGRRSVEFLSPEARPDALVARLKGALAAGAPSARLDTRYVRRDGQVRWARVSATPVHTGGDTADFVLGILEDTTDEREAHQALLQSERLNATGQLAAALAHEIKNPLQAVIGVLGLVAEAKERAVAERYLEVAREELHRADRILSRLRDLHRRPQPEALGPLSLPEVLDQVLLVVEGRAVAQDVAIVRSFAEGLPPVMGLADQLQQVFLNLVMNALDAMPDGGRLDLLARPTGDAATVVVEVGDTGHGIPADSLQHVFEFLYTTKRRGGGLGLFVCRDIVRAHGGRIDVRSEVGVGTTFTVELRGAAQGDDPTDQMPRSPRSEGQERGRSSERGVVATGTDAGSLGARPLQTVERHRAASGRRPLPRAKGSDGPQSARRKRTAT